MNLTATACRHVTPTGMRYEPQFSRIAEQVLPGEIPPQERIGSMILRCGGYQGTESVHTRALRVLEDEIRRAGGGVEIELTPNITEHGHKAVDLLKMVEGADLDLCYFSSSYLAERVQSLRLLDLPFPIADRLRAYSKLDGPLGDRLGDEIGRETGFRALAFWDNGFRHVTNRLRPIRRPSDCRGMKIRTLDNAVHREIFQAFGFEPVTIDVKDLPAAVASGAVDAQENPLTNTVNFGIHRTHRHISLTSHFFGVALLLVNRERFDNWSADAQQLVRAAAATATQAQRNFAWREDIDCLARLEKDGCKIVAAGEIDRAAFDSAVADIRNRELARIDPGLVAAF